MASDAQSQRQQARARLAELEFKKLHEAGARGASYDSLQQQREDLKKVLWDYWLNEGW